MICEKCKIEHNGSYGSGRFCSSKCSRSFSTSLKRCEINRKVSETLSNRGMGKEIRICPFCKKSFDILKRKPTRFCSKSCSARYIGSIPSERIKRRNRMVEKVKDGTHSGWKSRKGKPPSYPERFFIKVLNNNKIMYERDFPVGKWFIDFAIIGKKIALEIDGRQHEWTERKLKDREKDLYLLTNGWYVHRIKWKSINNEKGKSYIRDEIKKFLDIYDSNRPVA